MTFICIIYVIKGVNILEKFLNNNKSSADTPNVGMFNHNFVEMFTGRRFAQTISFTTIYS